MFSINLVFVSRQTIRSLNKKFRGVDKVTTVLSFYYGENGQVSPIGGQAVLPLGEVLICPEEAKKQKIKIEDLIVHGLKNILSEIPTAEFKRIGSG